MSVKLDAYNRLIQVRKANQPTTRMARLHPKRGFGDHRADAEQHSDALPYSIDGDDAGCAWRTCHTVRHSYDHATWIPQLVCGSGQISQVRTWLHNRLSRV